MRCLAVSDVSLHVYLDRRQIGRTKSAYDQYRTVGSGLVGMRAMMLYIHGNQKECAEENNRNWLLESAMTRLIDGNPARVVWCND